MGAVCGCSRPTATSPRQNSWPRESRRERVKSQPREPDFAETKNGGSGPVSENRETHEIGALTGACEVPQTLEVAEANSRHDNNKRVEEARRARVKWLEKLQRKCASQREFDTARSQSVWTQLDSSACSSSGNSHRFSQAALERIHYENRLHFQRLLDEETVKSKRNYFSWSELEGSEPSDFLSSSFYVDFGGRLKAGQKIGGGAQADIHEAIYDGKSLEWFVLKVFRSEHRFEDLQRSWTQPILLTSIGWTFTKREYNNYCEVRHGTLLEDGRFAFVLQKCWGDLRKAIDHEIVKDKTYSSPPFPHSTTMCILLAIAAGMTILHRNGIIHKDLKAANCLLVHNLENTLPDMKSCLVGDFESSNGVEGTGFWRAPEVLLTLKNRQKGIYSTQEVWKTKADVYSYAMTCYEVLTGCIPFEDCPLNYYDGVIRGERPPFPDYVDPKLQELLRRCWHSEPSMRPDFRDIVSDLSDIYPCTRLLLSLKF